MLYELVEFQQTKTSTRPDTRAQLKQQEFGTKYDAGLLEEAITELEVLCAMPELVEVEVIVGSPPEYTASVVVITVDWFEAKGPAVVALAVVLFGPWSFEVIQSQAVTYRPGYLSLSLRPYDISQFSHLDLWSARITTSRSCVTYDV